jgi:hypothetical protein
MSLLTEVPMSSNPMPGESVLLKLNEDSMIVPDYIRSKLATLARLFITMLTLPGFKIFKFIIAIIIWNALTMLHIKVIAYDKSNCMTTFAITEL